MDVLSEASVELAAKEISEKFGEVEVLINVAGILAPADRTNQIFETTAEELRCSTEMTLPEKVGAR